MPEAMAARLDVQQSGVGADRAGALAHELHAVVVRRIVARGDHDAAVELPLGGGEVTALSAAQADVQHIDAGFGKTALQRGRQAGLVSRMS